MRHLILFILAPFFLLACTPRPITPTIEEILAANPSLQQVLDHCQGDSLKYEAAKFLIENLPYHYGYEGEALTDYMRLFELHGQHTLYPEQVLDSIKKTYGPFRIHELRAVSDVHISPELLIENIDWAFKVWREQPWGKHISFDVFREYILPYRVADERLESWREYVYNKYNPLLDSLRTLPEAEDPIHAARILMDTLHKGPINFTGLFSFGPHYGYKSVDWRSGSCKDFTCLQLFVFRALGLPCSEEIMLIRGNGNVAHYWNAVFDKEGNSYYCSILDPTSELKDPTTMWDPKGKVYRGTFSVNREMMRQMNRLKEEVYPSFRHPCMIDVTPIYSGEKNWQIRIEKEQLYNRPKRGEPLYLCVPRYMEWEPLAWSKFNGREVVFDDVEGQVVFRLATYEEGALKLQSDPFLLERETGEIRFYPTGGKETEVKLLHKFNLYFEPFVRLMNGGVFEGSYDPHFITKDTLHLIEYMPERLWNVTGTRNNKSYRYVRFYGLDESHCDIAEASFYEHASDTIPLKGRVIINPGGTPIDDEHHPRNVFDGDPYTSFSHTDASGGWIGLDFGRPRQVNKIVFTARNRDNFIRTGDEYELFFADKNGWQSAGRTWPTSDSLLYTVPEGTLLYLKDHTRGKEERIFEYREGKQEFW